MIVSVKSQYDDKAHTACGFIAFNIIKNVVALGLMKKLYKDEWFVECYNYVLTQGIDIWKKYDSPPSLTMTDPRFVVEFEELMTYKNHYTDFCDNSECDTHCHILMMKSDYKRGLIKLRKLLEYIGNDEFNSVIINRDMKFIAITSLFDKGYPKYVIFDSHEHICQEMTINQTINYITNKKKYFGGIDFMVYKNAFDNEDYLHMLVYLLKNESSSSSSLSSLSSMYQ